MAAELGAPPRQLSHLESRALLWGHPACVAGTLLLTAGASLLWLFVALYGLRFGALVSLLQPRLRLPARAGETVRAQLLSGEAVRLTTASFIHQGKLYQVRSFGLEPPPAAGSAVQVLVPRYSPQQGWVVGGQRFPLRLSGLGWVALGSLLPGALFLAWGLHSGRRQRRLLQGGWEVPARRLRQLDLPRPFADLALGQYRTTTPAGVTQTFWTVGSAAGGDTRPALVDPQGGQAAVLVDNLLPGRGALASPGLGLGRSRQASAWVVLLLLAGHGLLTLLYALT
jgi:hypothetical protein